MNFAGFLVGGITRDHAVITNSIVPEICKLCHLQINASATPSRQDWYVQSALNHFENKYSYSLCNVLE